MYDTARRVALVKQRVRENTRRRQRSLRCASGSEARKTRKKAGQVSQTRRNRREKRHEKTNT